MKGKTYICYQLVTFLMIVIRIEAVGVVVQVIELIEAEVIIVVHGVGSLLRIRDWMIEAGTINRST